MAPDVERPEEPRVGDERAMLDGWLDLHRSTLLGKCKGLTGEQLATASVPPSNLTLLGLVRHMAEVERSWFRSGFLGQEIPMLYCSREQWDADFENVDAARAEADFAIFREECDECRRAIAGVPLDRTFVSRKGLETSLRWIYVHMIEEYARHNGHADLIRERLDGARGD
jgi:hypothetical protein